MKKIGIVDDSNPFVMLVRQLLEPEDVLVESYEDAAEFFRIPSRITGYDLIILDINLPNRDGLDVLDQLKRNAATRDIPVLLLSGDSRPEMVRKGVRSGAIDFLTKPIDPPQLVERVMGHLGVCEPQQEAIEGEASAPSAQVQTTQAEVPNAGTKHS
ncbi:response regulator [Paenibacillus campi]|uniref:response regulator n=1 Tax=Paenibacillus campi TaxID=3106031 RepID=UPI002AFEBE8D|nr:response regulator [Paenibacillus sp. SGZ-1009]